MTAMYYEIIILFYITIVESTLAPTHVMVTRAGPCHDNVKTAVTVSEVSLFTHTYDSILSGDLNISEDISNGWKIKATMQKCVDIRNTDSCDFFKSYYLVKNGCGDDDDEEQDMYGMLFHYAKPKLECPVQAGYYRIKDYPFFTEDNYLTVYESKISTSIFGYTYRLDGFTVDRRKVFCLESYLQLLYMREHDWSKNKAFPRSNSNLTVSEARMVKK